MFNLFQPEIVTNVNDCEKERFIDENAMTQFLPFISRNDVQMLQSEVTVW